MTFIKLKKHIYTDNTLEHSTLKQGGQEEQDSFKAWNQLLHHISTCSADKHEL